MFAGKDVSDKAQKKIEDIEYQITTLNRERALYQRVLDSRIKSAR